MPLILTDRIKELVKGKIIGLFKELSRKIRNRKIAVEAGKGILCSVAVGGSAATVITSTAVGSSLAASILTGGVAAIPIAAYYARKTYVFRQVTRRIMDATKAVKDDNYRRADDKMSKIYKYKDRDMDATFTSIKKALENHEDATILCMLMWAYARCELGQINDDLTKKILDKAWREAPSGSEIELAANMGRAAYYSTRGDFNEVQTLIERQSGCLFPDDSVKELYFAIRDLLATPSSSLVHRTLSEDSGSVSEISSQSHYRVICKEGGKMLWESSQSVSNGYALYSVSDQDNSSFSVFCFKPQGDGVYLIVCASGGRMLWESSVKVEGEDGYEVHCSSGVETSDDSKWKVVPAYDGTFSFFRANSKRQLWESGKSVENGYRVNSVSGREDSLYTRWSLVGPL